jgi:hypothetical protein
LTEGAVPAVAGQSSATAMKVSTESALSAGTTLATTGEGKAVEDVICPIPSALGGRHRGKFASRDGATDCRRSTSTRWRHSLVEVR